MPLKGNLSKNDSSDSFNSEKIEVTTAPTQAQKQNAE